MNDDYLWDKTGQPDPQIQQLEEILGTLRYQPKPLQLPRRRSYFPLLAIAASVLLALIAGAVWLRLRSRNEAPKQQARVETVTPRIEDTASIPETPKSPVNRSVVNRRKRSVASVLPKREREEALMAKEQVMLALRLTTEKLSLVHRRTQIKNQHKVG